MKTVIVTSFDENYMPYANVMVSTLSQNYSGLDKLAVYCLVPKNILDQEYEFIKSCGNISNIDIKFKTSNEYEKLNTEGSLWISKNAWHRMFIGSVCKDFDRAIYIDSDTIILRDIDPILNFPSYSVFMAYIQDEFSDHCGWVFKDKDVIYFNNGVFIADLNFWRENAIENNMVEYVKNNESTTFLEQDVANLFMREHVYPLPVTFNLFSAKEELFNANTDPLIVHFVGAEKPWNSYIDNIYHDKWKEKYKLLTNS